MGILGRLRGKLERVAMDSAMIRARRDELRTMFVVEGGELELGLARIESQYPGIAQPRDVAIGSVDGELELWEARRDGKRCIKWRRVHGWTRDDLLALRAACPHVLTIDARPALPP